MRILESLNCVGRQDEGEAARGGRLGGRDVRHAEAEVRAPVKRSESCRSKGVLKRNISFRLIQTNPAYEGERGLRIGLKGLDRFLELKERDGGRLERMLSSNNGEQGLGVLVTSLRLIKHVDINPWSEKARALLNQEVEGVALKQWGSKVLNKTCSRLIHERGGVTRVANQLAELVRSALALRNDARYQLDERPEVGSKLKALARSEVHEKVLVALQHIDESSHALQHCEAVTLSNQAADMLHRLIREEGPVGHEIEGMLKTRGDLRHVAKMVDAIGFDLPRANTARPVLKVVEDLDASSRALQSDSTTRLGADGLQLLHDSIVSQQLGSVDFAKLVRTRGDLDLVHGLANALSADVGAVGTMLESLASQKPDQLLVLEGLRSFAQSTLQDWGREVGDSLKRFDDPAARLAFAWPQFRQQARVDEASGAVMKEHLSGPFIERSLVILDAAIERVALRSNTDQAGDLRLARALLVSWAELVTEEKARVAPSPVTLTPLDEVVLGRLLLIK